MSSLSRELLAADAERARPRFEAALERGEPEECWYLRGAARSNGYGVFTFEGRSTSGHRIAYALYRGDLTASMEIDHLCADRACVNPAHLGLVTRQENLRRRNLENRFDLISEDARTRLLARREIDENGCWRWPGAKVRGYGVMSVDGRTEYVHRLILRLDGVLDEEMTVDHLCRRIDCFNPEHLEQVTRAENTRRSQMGGPRRERTCSNGHRKSEVGRWRGGACKGCYPDGLPRPDREPLIPRERRADVDVVCANGHRYDEVGRYPSGSCKACQLAKDLARHKGPPPPQQFCVRGHDVTVVGRSLSNGECRQCARDYAREKYGYKTTAEDLVTSCRRGHPRERTVIVTRTRNGKEQQEKKCLDCRAEALARHAAKKAAGG